MVDRVIPELTSDLDHWEVVLADGSMLRLLAHSYGEDRDAFVFYALMKGTPAYEYELLRIPKDAVRDIEGGWATPRSRGAR
jgi:hypothetical protein